VVSVEQDPHRLILRIDGRTVEIRRPDIAPGAPAAPSEPVERATKATVAGR
jgi:hypothetical protein